MDALEQMSYCSDLERRKLTNFSHTVSPYPSDETLIYINIAGQNNEEIQSAFDCIYFDDKRKFNIVDIKTQNFIMSALVVMSSDITPKPIKF